MLECPMARKRRGRPKAPPNLFKRTQAIVAEVQKRVPGTFLTYWTSTSGSVCDNDVMALHEVLRSVPVSSRITLFVRSDGGSGMAALRMVHLMRTYARHITVVVSDRPDTGGAPASRGAGNRSAANRRERTR